MSRDALLARWTAEERQPFSGWDFSYLDGRVSQNGPPWSYSARAAELLEGCSSVLDLGTAGGERLLELRDHWPAHVTATEEHPPNYHLALQRLAPLGVRVVGVRLTDDALMPFSDGEFDLVLNRHSAFNCAEVARVLAPGGTFLTQQVHGRNLEDLQAHFGAAPQWPDATPAKYVPRLQTAGMRIVDLREWSGWVEFADVGALVYYLKAVPWLVPGFSVASHAEALQRLETLGVPLRFSARSYLLEARFA